MSIAATIEKSIARARQAFFKNLPKRLECPHCGQHRAKEKFGVRLVNRDEVVKGKAKPQFFRQSHCNTCRG